MHDMKRTGLSLGLGLALLILTGFGSKDHPSQQSRSDEVSRHVAQLRSGKPQQKAAAAYWLGQQHTVSPGAGEALVQLLCNTHTNHPFQYRPFPPEPRLTP